MRKLLKYASAYWKSVLLIFLILILQAYCELSLPAYTSDIVNIGIQQGGIGEHVPKAISKEEMERILILIPSDEEKQEILEAYTVEKDEYDVEAYVMKTEAEQEEVQSRLYALMRVPMMTVQSLSAEDSPMEEMISSLMASVPQEMLPQDADVFDVLEMLPREQIEEMVTNIQAQMEEVPEAILEQASVIYVRSAYKGLGMDMDKIQIQYLISVGLKMIFLAFFCMAANIIAGFLAARTAAMAGRDLRKRVFRKVVGFSSNEFDTFSTASLITRSTNDIQQIQMLMVMLLRIVLYAPIMAAGGVYQVFQTNVSMSWIIGLAVILIGMVVLTLFLVAMPKFKLMQKLVDRLNLVTREILTGLPVIRAFSAQKHEEERFDKANRDLTRTNLFVNRAMTFMMPVMMVIMNAVSVLIVWNGAVGIDAGEMQVGDMMAFIQYTMQIIMSFLMLCMISIMLPRAAVAAERVDEVLRSKTIIHDTKTPKHFEKKAKGVLQFSHVSFRYPGAEEDVLTDISFTAKPGETTAIIGSTGSGKSTLVNLIPRFYDVTEGKITLDGVDIRDVTQHELRERLGYVPQKAALFSGTIASNILFANPEDSEDTMRKAAEIAQATEFIDAKPDKYDSVIAQGGSNVSGGQKQRLSIARAVAKHPDVFVFDDSFSALDYKTDVTLRKALRESTRESTVIIVAQRISTILHAEQILVLDEGRLAGVGTHEELLKNCDVYYQIAASQLSEEELGGGVGA